MKRYDASPWYISAALAVSVAGFGTRLSNAQQPPPRPDGEEGVQVLTRGPVHEAFAGTLTYDPEPGIVVTMTPPDPIEEIPPDQRPEGAGVTWIPGYNAWDDERNDYLWVSGVWRSPPPGRHWIPGYWGRSSQGFQWTSGYWGDAQLRETEYLPEPPGTVEAGPSMPAPSSDHSWIPGCWLWQYGRYAWRPGYWVTLHSDWDWVPGHYTWAPRGYVFVDGYWDYSIERRGVLFAPIYFDAGIYGRREYRYSPSTVISLAVFSDHLFVRPRYHHYYFGDYYDAGYNDAGYYSHLSFQTNRYGYDPIYAHQRWKHRQDSDWEARVESDFRRRRDHVEARPVRTLKAQLTLNATGSASNERGLVLATSLDQVVRNGEGPVRFQAVESSEKQVLVQRGKEVGKFREERQRLERDVTTGSASEGLQRVSPGKVVIPRSPIVAKRVEELTKDRTPPKRQVVPEPDPKIEGKPRKHRPDAASPVSRSEKEPNADANKQPKGKSKKKQKND